MQLLSAGAAGTVTGSCHLIELSGKKILIDCGMFQGPRELELKNRDDFPFEVGDIDAVLVTHGHLDHIGRLPLLIKRGYQGPIYTIKATQDIARVILLDSAKIQQEDYERAMRKARRRGEEDKVDEPLYDEEDATQALRVMSEPVSFEKALDLGNGVSASFHPAGHILGSAFIELDSPDGRVICSGDLGNRESALQADAALPRECDAVLVETTYADRTHRDLSATLEEFRSLIDEAVERGGNVMIPSFALERTQVVLYHLNEMMQRGDIPNMPVFLDSPMATKMTRLYQECANEFNEPIKEALERGDDPFEPPTLTYTVTPKESMAINDISGGAIIIAGSGMMTGGRIVHHLKHNLWRENASLIVVGYQAQGTLGRKIVEGAESVRIMGDSIIVRARVETVNGFSAHADQDDLLRWLEPTGNANIYLVHGEKDVMDEFDRVLQNKGRHATSVVEAREYKLG